MAIFFFRKDGKDVLYLIIVSVIFLACLFQNIIFLKEDTVPLLSDTDVLYSDGLGYYASFIRLDFSSISGKLDSYSHFYSPLILFQAFPFYLLFGASQDSASLSNSLFLLLLIFSVYFAGKKIRDGLTGAIAAISIASFPLVLPLSRVYLPDFAVASLFGVSCVFFFNSGFLKKRKESIFFGLSVGLGIFSRINFIVYAAPLFISAAFVLFREKEMDHPKERIINIFIALASAIIISAPWYLLQGTAGYIFDRVSFVRQSNQEILGAFAYLDNLAFIFWNLLGWAIVFAGLASVYILFARKDNYYGKHLLFWIAAGLAGMSLYPILLRYALPFAVPLSLIIALGARDLMDFVGIKLQNKRAVIFFIVSFTILMQANYYISIASDSPGLSERETTFGIRSPVKNDLRIEEFASFLFNETVALEKNGSVKILFMHYSPITNPIQNSVLRKAEGIVAHNIIAHNIIECISENSLFDANESCHVSELAESEGICGYDFIIYSTKYENSINSMVFRNFPERREMVSRLEEAFRDCAGLEKAAVFENMFFDDTQNTTLEIYRLGISSKA